MSKLSLNHLIPCEPPSDVRPVDREVYIGRSGRNVFDMDHSNISMEFESRSGKTHYRMELEWKTKGHEGPIKVRWAKYVSPKVYNTWMEETYGKDWRKTLRGV